MEYKITGLNLRRSSGLNTGHLMHPGNHEIKKRINLFAILKILNLPNWQKLQKCLVD